MGNFNPRSPCGERPASHPSFPPADGISIHALLAESDVLVGLDVRRHHRFQSTLSLRRATLGQNISQRGYHHFNPRSPCGERPGVHPMVRYLLSISIHALLAESDTEQHSTTFERHYFNPRSPCGERPSGPEHRAGDDKDFNPRSPCGERRIPDTLSSSRVEFQSTLSLRRATGQDFGIHFPVVISIHALLAESDPLPPRPPQRPRISIHALLAESDVEASILRGGTVISIHALLAESDRSLCLGC